MMTMLGAGADLPSSRGAGIFLESARAALAALLEGKRYGRDSALDLLAVDALMTFAYEHAAEHAERAADLRALAHQGVTLVAPLAPSHG
jgi:hypothetical protein